MFVLLSAQTILDIQWLSAWAGLARGTHGTQLCVPRPARARPIYTSTCCFACVLNSPQSCPPSLLGSHSFSQLQACIVCFQRKLTNILSNSLITEIGDLKQMQPVSYVLCMSVLASSILPMNVKIFAFSTFKF